jgi:hypothetical protein
MTSRQQVERWGPVALAVICVVLAIRMVSQLRGNEAHADRPPAPSSNPARASRKPASTMDKPAAGQFDSHLQIDLLGKLENRPTPDMARDPFEFVMPKVAPKPAAVTLPPKPPPPPPPLPLKAVGYSEGTGGLHQAYVSYQEQVFVVGAGDTISGRYKVIQVTPEMVQVEDSVTGQKGDLPIPK